MKTKKSILTWWLKLGETTENINDLVDFRNKIDVSIQSEEETIIKNGLKQLVVKLQSPRWKHSLYLWFVDKECITITGF